MIRINLRVTHRFDRRIEYLRGNCAHSSRRTLTNFYRPRINDNAAVCRNLDGCLPVQSPAGGSVLPPYAKPHAPPGNAFTPTIAQTLRHDSQTIPQIAINRPIIGEKWFANLKKIFHPEFEGINAEPLGDCLDL